MTARIDRWTVMVAIGFILLWLTWFLSGADLVRAYLVSVAPQDGHGPVDATAYLQQLGQVGDVFGGFSALFAALACTGAVWAGGLQRQTLLETQKAFEFERNAVEAARAATALQQFESTFFNLLDLNRATIDVIQLPMESQTTSNREEFSLLRGIAAIEHLSNVVYSNVSTSRNVDNPSQSLIEAKDAVAGVLSKPYASSFGLYIRSLFQVLKLVDEMPPELIPYPKKVRYSNIARGQIPPAALLLVAICGLTGESAPLKTLIERYGLLKYLPKQYSRIVGALKCGYHADAFLGVNGRSNCAS